jgi:AraC family transcriptional activator of pobA
MKAAATPTHIFKSISELMRGLVLSAGTLSVAEIAYTSGFEHPQSFHKLFKRATSFSPLAFRQTFN